MSLLGAPKAKQFYIDFQLKSDLKWGDMMEKLFTLLW